MIMNKKLEQQLKDQKAWLDYCKREYNYHLGKSNIWKENLDTAKRGMLILKRRKRNVLK